MVDFLEAASEMGLLHVIEEICGHLPVESILNMMLVCKAWKDILSRCRAADRLCELRASGLSKWQVALDGEGQGLKALPLPLVESRMGSPRPGPPKPRALAIEHNLLFCHYGDEKEKFWVYKLVDLSVCAPRHFRTPTCRNSNEPAVFDRFHASVDFHQSSEESVLFSVQWAGGGSCSLGNHETGSLSGMSFPGTSFKFAFNRDYVMAAVDENRIRFLRLYKLTWSNGQVQHRVLVDEVDLGLSEWHYDIFRLLELGALGKLMVFLFDDCTASVWTFEKGQLAEFQTNGLMIFEPAYFDQRIQLVRSGNSLVFTMSSGSIVQVILICEVRFSTKEIVPVKRLERADANREWGCLVYEVAAFGNLGLLVWHDNLRRSLVSVDEVLRRESLETLVLPRKGIHQQFSESDESTSPEEFQIGGCKMCIITKCRYRGAKLRMYTV